MSIFARPRVFFNDVEQGHHRQRRNLLGSLAAAFGSCLLSRSSATAKPCDDRDGSFRSPTLPTARASGQRSRRLAELAERFDELGVLQAAAETESEVLRVAYWGWHERRPCHRPKAVTLCQDHECLVRWDAYSEKHREAEIHREEREDVYGDIRVEVDAALEEAGIEPPPTLAGQFAGSCRPFARVIAGGRTYLLTGSYDFFQAPYTEGSWGHFEVVIDG